MEREPEVQPSVGFLDLHSKANLLTPGMRMIVVSWLVEVAEELRLQQETLHLAVALLDRFLANTQVWGHSSGGSTAYAAYVTLEVILT